MMLHKEGKEEKEKVEFTLNHKFFFRFFKVLFLYFSRKKKGGKTKRSTKTETLFLSMMSLTQLRKILCFSKIFPKNNFRNK